MNNDLISRSVLLAEIEEDIEWAQEEGQEDIFGLKLAKKRAKQAPAVDAEPVRHGCWEHEGDGYYFCKRCKKYIVVIGRDADLNYCPNCGAKMDGDVND